MNWTFTKFVVGICAIARLNRVPALLTAAFFILSSMFAVKTYAQIPVTVTGSATTPALQSSYPNLAAALADLNAVSSMSGPVTFTLSAGAETAPNTGLVIGSASLDAVLSATNTVTILLLREQLRSMQAVVVLPARGQRSRTGYLPSMERTILQLMG